MSFEASGTREGSSVGDISDLYLAWAACSDDRRAPARVAQQEQEHNLAALLHRYNSLQANEDSSFEEQAIEEEGSSDQKAPVKDSYRNEMGYVAGFEDDARLLSLKGRVVCLGKGVEATGYVLWGLGSDLVGLVVPVLKSVGGLALTLASFGQVDSATHFTEKSLKEVIEPVVKWPFVALSFFGFALRAAVGTVVHPGALLAKPYI